MTHRHALTALVLIAALVCYGLGLGTPAAGLVFAGMALELWFWVRLLRRQPRPHRKSV
jgi:hypothetical protein